LRWLQPGGSTPATKSPETKRIISERKEEKNSKTVTDNPENKANGDELEEEHCSDEK